MKHFSEMWHCGEGDSHVGKLWKKFIYGLANFSSPLLACRPPPGLGTRFARMKIMIMEKGIRRLKWAGLCSAGSR